MKYTSIKLPEFLSKNHLPVISLIFIMEFIFSTLVFSQHNNNLPEDVKNAFNLKYPQWSIDKWNYEEGLYYLEFYKKGGMFTSVFDENGLWIETSQVIADSEIPGSLNKYIEEDYPFSELLYSEKVESSASGNYIRVYLSNDDELLIVKSDPGGDHISVEKK